MKLPHLESPHLESPHSELPEFGTSDIRDQAEFASLGICDPADFGNPCIIRINCLNLSN